MRVLLLFLLVCVAYAKVSNFADKNNYENDEAKEYSGPSELGVPSKKYKPDWKDLDTRPLPQWYDKAKIGIFLHWGVFSVPSFYSEWFWTDWKDGKHSQVNKFMSQNYPPGFTYQDFGPMFTAEFFDPQAWAQLFAASGAKYVVLTSKHHEGFTLFPSKRSFSWNAVDIGPKRDLVGDVAKAVRNVGLKFGVYHSLYEWFNPIYQEDKSNNYNTHYYPDTKVWPDIKQLINDYKPSVIWSDGDWEAHDTYWKSTELLAWLYNESPVKDEIVVNDRWGIGIQCHHGDFYNCADRYNPHTKQSHKWENAFTVDSQSWGYRRNMDLKDVLSNEQLLFEVVSTVSCGGNALINVGPTKEGTIPLIFQERLLTLGSWLKINGEGIYDTSPWFHQNDTVNDKVWYTCKTVQYNALQPTAEPVNENSVTEFFAISLYWPENNKLKIKDVTSYLHSGTYQVEMLGHKGYLEWKIHNGETTIQLPDKTTVKTDYAWTLKFTKK